MKTLAELYRTKHGAQAVKLKQTGTTASLRARVTVAGKHLPAPPVTTLPGNHALQVTKQENRALYGRILDQVQETLVRLPSDPSLI